MLANKFKNKDESKEFLGNVNHQIYQKSILNFNSLKPLKELNLPLKYLPKQNKTNKQK